MSSNLAKTVLITGAEGALGGAVVEKFLKAGCEVTGTFLHTPPPQEKSVKNVNWVKVDLTDSQSVKTAFAGKEYDTLVHCAGGFRYSEIEKISDDDLDFLMNTNLRSAFYLVRELLPEMKKRNFGRIIFISSRMTLAPTAGMGAYAATKAGLNMLTAALAEETKSFDINVNAVLPTVIDTPANRKDMPKSKFSDWVHPNDLAEIIFSLTTPWGKPIHGALIPVAGRV